MRGRWRLSTKDLVTIALLSALGGVLSTYIGYLGNLMNHVVGVPFGAGQFMAGLHVLWIMLAIGLTRRKGAGTVTGLVKGIVELFSGSTHGIVIVLVSCFQGVVADAVMFSNKAKEEKGYTTYAVAGGLSAATNVIVFQALFFSGVPWLLILMLCMLAFASGMIFAGWLSIEMLSAVERIGILGGSEEIMVDGEGGDAEHVYRERIRSEKRRRASLAIVGSFLAVFSAGAIYYFAFVFVLPGGDSISVEGDVANAYDFFYEDFAEHERTVNAELIGSVTHVAPMDYTGVPLALIIAEAQPAANATEVVVTGSDGYYATFALEDILTDEDMLIGLDGDSFRLIAAGYEGAYWIDLVVSIEVR
ncbi:MAG: ECF transporter S component [Methanobacteriota archaeon]|nr:MAG: ECF transporter S component [Euryarchaeota archaeon]